MLILVGISSSIFGFIIALVCVAGGLEVEGAECDHDWKEVRRYIEGDYVYGSSIVFVEKCPFCGCDTTNMKFRDKLSEKEFRISGLCQKCQDETFGC